MKSNLLFLLLLFLSSLSFASEQGWEKAYSNIALQVENEINGEALVSFSAYELDKKQVPINNLNEIAITDKVQFISGKSIWRKNIYTSEVLVNPTWLDITIFANEMIIKTKDTHHVFLEDIEFVRKDKDIKIYDFIMGS